VLYTVCLLNTLQQARCQHSAGWLIGLFASALYQRYRTAITAFVARQSNISHRLGRRGGIFSALFLS